MSGDDLRLPWPFAMLVAGPSGCGKTSMVADIAVRNIRTMQKRPKEILIYCSYDQPAYGALRRQAGCPVTVVKGPIPDGLKTKKRTLLIVDDLQGMHSEVVSRWFTVKSHHLATSLIYIVQNVFDKTPHHRTISLNATHIVLFKNPRDSSQVMHLAKQVYPKDPSFLVRAYTVFTEGRPHSYIVMDFNQRTPDHLRFRSGLFPYDMFPPTYVYAREEFDQTPEFLRQRALSDPADN